MSFGHMQMAILAFVLLSAQLAADEKPPKSNIEPVKLVIQVSSADEVKQKVALNNAVNMQKALGQDNITIEVVAYGPGLSLLTDKSSQLQRVASLAMQEIRFSACGTSMNKLAKKTGHMPVLIEGVQVVPAGVIRIMELQEQGYAYIRP